MAHQMLVEAVIERLSDQSPLEPHTLEAVLDTLSLMGLLNMFASLTDAFGFRSQPESQQIATSPDPAWTMTFQTYLSLSDGERRELVLDVQSRNQDWIARQLDAHQAEWILVCGGKVIESSDDLNDYPSPQRLMQVGWEHDYIPFVFSCPPLFEETAWSKLENNDFYPTLSISIGAGDWAHSTLFTQGRILTADFDTGSPYLFFSWEWLLSENLVVPTPVDFPLCLRSKPVLRPGTI
jgi:hypothetical protein